MDDRFITLQEVAELMGLPLSYVYRLSAENRLPGKVKHGQRTVRVSKNRLKAWLDDQAQGFGEEDN